MTPRSPLPAAFRTGPFLVRAAIEGGVSRGRLRGSDLARPFRGIRTADEAPSDLKGRCVALQFGLPTHAVFSHSTAALIMGMPLPLSVETRADLHVSVLDPRRPPVIRGVIGHQIAQLGAGPGTWMGLRVTSPVHTWCLLAEQLTVPDLVAVADFLITGTHPLATIDQLTAGVAASGGRRGVVKLAAALPLVRSGPLSRPETHARLLYTAAGLPEPELNGKILDEWGRFVAMSDLVWREYRVANEYEGKHHQETGQFRRDILRRERVEDIGWRLSRFTADDLRLRPAETVARMANRLRVTVSTARMRGGHPEQAVRPLTTLQRVPGPRLTPRP